MRLLAKTSGIVLSLAMTASSSSALSCHLQCWLGELHAGCGMASAAERRTGAAYQQPTETDTESHHHCKSARQSGDHESISDLENSVQFRPCAGQPCALTASRSALASTRAHGSLHGVVTAGSEVWNACRVGANSRPIRSPGSPPGSVPLCFSISPLRI
jgi:hypothetical protein